MQDGLPRQRALPYLLLLIAAASFGGNWVAARVVNFEVAPFALSFWRWAIALVLLLPFAVARGCAAHPPALSQAVRVRRDRRRRLHSPRLLGRELYDRDQRDPAELFAAPVRRSPVVAAARADGQRQAARRAGAVARRRGLDRQRGEPANARPAQAQSRGLPAPRRRIPVGDLHGDAEVAPSPSRVVVPVYDRSGRGRGVAAVLPLGNGDGKDDGRNAHGRGDDRLSRDLSVDRRLHLLERGGDRAGTECSRILQPGDPGVRHLVRSDFSRRAAPSLPPRGIRPGAGRRGAHVQALTDGLPA